MEFIRCPKCGEFDEKRTQCRCGYSAAAAAAAVASKRQQAQQSPGCLGVLARAVGGWVRGLLLLVSAGLIIWGYDQYTVSQGAAEQPQEIDLAKLEAGDQPGQNHIRIGKHIRLYPNLIYVISARDKNNNDPFLRHTFYPIISLSHPDRPKNAAQAKEDPVPVKHFAVLVKTTAFRRLADVPAKAPVEASIQGMVVNSITQLSADEAKLIKESFPDMDTGKIIILEQGRTPSSGTQSLALMGGGILLAVFTLSLYFLGGAARTDGDD